MKKYSVSIVLICLLFLSALSSYSRPIYIGFRLGLFAKLQFFVDECQDGYGVCIAKGNPANPDNASIGYDESSTNVLYIKVEGSSDVAKPFASGKFEFKEDSPVSPEIIKSLTNMRIPKNKYVVLKSGAYPVTREGEFYIVKIPYYLK